MGEFTLFRLIWAPAGSQDNGPEKLTVRIKLQDVKLARVVFLVKFSLFFYIVFIAVFI